MRQSRPHFSFGPFQIGPAQIAILLGAVVGGIVAHTVGGLGETADHVKNLRGRLNGLRRMVHRGMDRRLDLRADVDHAFDLLGLAGQISRVPLTAPDRAALDACFDALHTNRDARRRVELRAQIVQLLQRHADRTAAAVDVLEVLREETFDNPTSTLYRAIDLAITGGHHENAIALAGVPVALQDRARDIVERIATLHRTPADPEVVKGLFAELITFAG